MNPILALLQQGAAGIPTQWGGNGGGIVPTPEQVAASEAAAAQLGTPSPADVLYQDAQVPPEAPAQPITVRANVAQPYARPSILDYESPEEAPNLSNTAQVEAALKAQKENDKLHSGMFGVKGTLRNVLGILGDAFLVQSGNNPIYAPGRQRERAQDALTGFTQSPLGAMERMSQVDVDTANDMHKDYQTAMVQAAQQRAAEQKARLENYAKGVKLFGAAASASNAETYKNMRPILEKLKTGYGLGDEFQIPEEYDANIMGAYGDTGMSSDAQARIEQGDRRLDQADTGLGIRSAAQQETARHNRAMESAARARIAKMGGSSRARADTPLEYFRALESIPASQRSAEENAWIQNYTGQNRSSSGRSGRSQSSGGSRPRVLRSRPVN